MPLLFLFSDRWKIVTSTILKAFEVNFELGKPFDTTTPDGRDVVCTIRQVRR